MRTVIMKFWRGQREIEVYVEKALERKSKKLDNWRREEIKINFVTW